MTRTILLSTFLTAMLITVGAVGYVAGDTNSDSDACDADFDTSKPTQYRGTATGPNGSAMIVVNVDKKKVTGSIKGDMNGANWNAGVTGTVAKKAITASGANAGKNTKITLTGDICGKNLYGTLSGKTLDKDAWFLVKIAKQ